MKQRYNKERSIARQFCVARMAGAIDGRTALVRNIVAVVWH